MRSRQVLALFILTTTAVLALLTAAAAQPVDLLLFNPSSSVPSGFYVRIDAPPGRDAVVTVRARDVAASYAAERGFTDAGDRFLKRVAAAAGDVVCANGADLTINGSHVAARQRHDAAGRRLPTWSGCRTLSADEMLLLGDTPDSFDGRYWGPVSRRVIEGVWRPLAR